MTKQQKKQLVISESMRYIDNALETLKTKAKPVGYFYEDPKYVKAAGHYAYHGVLYAINETGLVKTKKGQRLDVKDYQNALAKENKKMLHYFNQCYEIFHLQLGYDGFANKKTLPVYVDFAKELIVWAANKAAA
jgi:hypothetical protein